jgi:predicted site-specific integrase-resolvase
MNSGNAEQMVTVRQAAEQCHRNAETIRRWIWSGKLPAKKLGNQLFVNQEHLSAVCGRNAEYERVEDWLKQAKALRERIRKKTGLTFDPAELVRESREEYLRRG